MPPDVGFAQVERVLIHVQRVALGLDRVQERLADAAQALHRRFHLRPASEARVEELSSP